jgi:hypothetical protein
MTVRRSIPLRWAEDAEAEQMCAMARFEREPQEIAACRAAVARPAPAWSGPALLARLLSRFGGRAGQIARDDRR